MGQSSNTTGTGGKDTLADGVDEYEAATWTQNIIQKYCSANKICEGHVRLEVKLRDEVTGKLEKEFVNMRADYYPITDPTEVQWRLVVGMNVLILWFQFCFTHDYCN